MRYLAKRFRDEGFEVVFTNFLLPAEIVATAVQEDVAVVGISSSSGGHMPVLESLMKALSAVDATDVLVIAGGVIPANDVARLKEIGVGEVFGPGASAGAAVEFIQQHVEPRAEAGV